MFLSLILNGLKVQVCSPVKDNRGLTEEYIQLGIISRNCEFEIFNWGYFFQLRIGDLISDSALLDKNPQLDISNPQLVIVYPIGNC